MDESEKKTFEALKNMSQKLYNTHFEIFPKLKVNAYNMCSQIIQEILDEIFDNLQLNKHTIII